MLKYHFREVPRVTSCGRTAKHHRHTLLPNESEAANRSIPSN